MSERPPNVNRKNQQSPKRDDSKPESGPDKRKLNFSQSDNNFDHQKSIKHKLLGKVKSWSSKDQHSKNKCISVELDLARSLSKLEVSESVDDLGSNLLRARDSLDNLLKDEQNMPKSSLEKSILHPKPRNISDSPKSSPQLGENYKASSSKMPFWDSYGKKNRKDAKKKGKSRSMESPRTDLNAIPTEGKTTSIMKKADDNSAGDDNSTNQDTSVMEEENSYRFKYFPKNSKSVVFTNEVLVVYFNNEDVVGEEKEPLKKEVEQQTRNKEMRRIHLNKTQEKYNLCLF